MCLLLNGVCPSLCYALTPDESLRFQQLTAELRCVVCQNQDLAESNTPLAVELRQQITEQLHQKKSNAEITTYLSTRYGEFILFKPSFSPKNYLLWLAPFGFLMIALFILVRLSKRRHAAIHQKPLSHDEQQQLNQVLKP